ncbi:MAG: CRISPR-associated endonuclease Cas1 [Stenomitos frigidus ULC029]
MTTIYVAQPQTELRLQSRQLQIFHRQKFCFAVPLSRVNQMVILGQQPWTRKATNLALSLHIPVLYFEPNGQCVEYTNPPSFEPARYLTLQRQRSQDHEFTRSTAESLVRAKLHNARVLLLKLSAPPSSATVQQVLMLLQRLENDLPLAPTLADIKSYESTGAAFYRAALSRLLPDAFREQNLGINPIRRLTDLGMALLSQRLQTVLQTLGLDLEVANLHVDALTRPPLVCDFLTELQGPIVDSLVMALLHAQQILPDDFLWFEQGIFLCPEALERFIQHWDEKLSTTVDHLYAGEVSYYQCLTLQAQEYLACLLEDEPFYRPMLLPL